jgi:hypothetical protein
MGLVTGISIGCVLVVIGYFLWRWVRSLRAWLFATRRGPDNNPDWVKSTIPLQGHGAPADKGTLLKLEQGQCPKDQWNPPLRTRKSGYKNTL